MMALQKAMQTALQMEESWARLLDHSKETQKVQLTETHLADLSDEMMASKKALLSD